MALSRRSFLRSLAMGSAAMTVGTATAASAAGLTVSAPSALAASGTGAGALQLAVAHPRTAAHRAMLARMDDTHAIVDGGVELLLWPGDAAKLVQAGVPFEITVADVVARDAAEAAVVQTAAQADLLAQIPGGKTDYQSLDGIYAELQALADANPDLARVVELPNRTLEGRTVKGIEIGRGNTRDGRPVAYYDGCHHAREWPSADYCRLFAHHLIETAGTPRTDAILDNVLVRIVPVVNADGYVHSFSHKGRVTDNANLGIVAGGQGAYVRKNNRVAPADQAHAADAAIASTPATGEVDAHYGVDPNRNYAYLWGGTTGGLVNYSGPGAETLPLYASTSPNPTDQTYFGTDAFSEPITRNTREFFLSNAVVTYLSNHTSGRLMLRPWGHTTAAPPDEALLTDLGQRMSKAMEGFPSGFGQYENKIGLGLYATNGTSNDWAYAATGALGYVVEHSTSFHPTYSSAHAPGQCYPGVMEMFTTAAEEAMRTRSHSIVKGRTSGPATLQLTRSFDTPYSRNGGARDIGSLTAGRTELAETQVLELAVDGAFSWHVNPSTRPIAEIGDTVETYTLTVTTDGATTTREITITRGETLDLGDLV